MSTHRGSDLDFALHLADVAAAVTLAGFGGRIEVELKSDATPVTAIDSAAERVIRDEVARHFPDDGFVGEELGEQTGSSGRTWVIDPIDGTKMFAEGIPLWTTLIAMRNSEGLVAAVADAPALGNRYHAARGAGAFRDGRRIQVSDEQTLSNALVLHAPVEEFMKGSGIDALARVVNTSRASRGIGDGWAHLLVAQGSADALVEQGPCFEWDYAATSLIITEAGGTMTQLDGSPPAPGCHLLVTNLALAAQLIAAI